jgi:glycosyltransferase involved in cell wall biosynthesis
MSFKSKHIAFYFIYDVNWIGGVYYKKHLITALANYSPQRQIFVFTDLLSIDKISNLLHGLPVTIKIIDADVPKGIGRIEIFGRKILGISIWAYITQNLNNFVVFDYHNKGILRNVPLHNRIYWIPDLQDKFLPSLFNISSLEQKESHYRFLSSTAKHIVFSSNDSYMNFREFYPNSQRHALKVSLLRFTVQNPDIKVLNHFEILQKYNVSKEKYYIISNQFMAHKNHLLIIQVINLFKKKYTKVPFKVVMTGKMHDPRNEAFFSSLTAAINELELENDIFFTGEIDRIEQLILLFNSKAVIQPSKFEGWNSTVEDVKFLNKFIICSDLKVHLEQLEDYPNKVFFNSENIAELLEIIINNWNTNTKENMYDYYKNQLSFSKDLNNIFL